MARESFWATDQGAWTTCGRTAGETTVFKGGAEEAVGNQDFMVSADGTRAAFRELRGRNPVWIVDNAL